MAFFQMAWYIFLTDSYKAVFYRFIYLSKKYYRNGNIKIYLLYCDSTDGSL